MEQKDVLHNISIRKFKDLFPDMPGKGLGDDLLIAELRYDKELKVFQYPFRFDGYIIIFCLKGRIKLDVNLDSFQIAENSLVLNVPGNIIRVSGIDRDDYDNMHFIVVAMSKNFMSSVRFDFNRLFNESVALMDNPCISLDDHERTWHPNFLLWISRIKKRPSEHLCLQFHISSALFGPGVFPQQNISHMHLLPRRRMSTTSSCVL